MTVSIKHDKNIDHPDCGDTAALQPSDWNGEHVVSGLVEKAGDTMTGALVITPAVNSTAILQVNDAAGAVVLNVDTTNGRVGIGTNAPESDFYIRPKTANGGLVVTVPDGPRHGVDILGNANGGVVTVYYVGNKKINLRGLGDSYIYGTGNLIIGERTGSGKLTVDGNSDQVQLLVQAHSTQTANVFQQQQSDGTVVLYTTNSGALKISDKLIFTQTDGNEYIDSLADGYLDLGATTAIRVKNLLDVTGDVRPTTDDTYYLGLNDDDSPQAWKGVILKDTTDGKYYRIEVINGVVTATDLTD